MSCYLNKKEFYDKMQKIKKEYNLNDLDNFDINFFCDKHHIDFNIVNFTTSKLRGVAIPNNSQHIIKDTIMLNSNLTDIEKMFYFFHEFLHIICHKNLKVTTFNCFDDISNTRNSYLEWQANEGAAEILMPYRDVLSIIKNTLPDLSEKSINNCMKTLERKFGVTKYVIDYRIESLKYEIYQHLKGIDINDIEILSINKQEQQGIHIKSLNTYAIEKFFNNRPKIVVRT